MVHASFAVSVDDIFLNFLLVTALNKGSAVEVSRLDLCFIPIGWRFLWLGPANLYSLPHFLISFTVPLFEARLPSM